MQGEEEEKEQKPVWLQEDGQEAGTPTSANASGLNLQAPTATQPHDPQGAADFIGLDDDEVPGELAYPSLALLSPASTGVHRLLGCLSRHAAP